MLTRSSVDNIDDPEIRFKVKEALATLWASEVFLRESEYLAQNLLQGPDTQPPLALAESIVQYRRKAAALLTIHELGRDYSKELNK